MIRDYYYGFSFDGNTKLYCPESIHSFLNFNIFENYLLMTNTSDMLRKFLIDKTLTVDQFEGNEVDFNFVNNHSDINSTPPRGFLYQTGYLTLSYKDRALYDLVYPNLEVRKTFSALFLENLHHNSEEGCKAGHDSEKVGKTGRDLAKDIAVANIVGMVDVFDTLFSKIYYSDHANVNNNANVNNHVNVNNKPEYSCFETIVREEGGNILEEDGKYLSDAPVQRLSTSLAEKIQDKSGEGFYRSVLHACLWMAGAKDTLKKYENICRPDLDLPYLALTYGGLTYILGLKITDDIGSGPKAAREGMDQMHDTAYGLPSENSILVTLAIGRKERNIVACAWEKDHKQMSIITKAHLRYLKSLTRS
jgi:hypothetical protein